MDLFLDAYNFLFFQPLLNIFIFLIQIMPYQSAGLAVIFLTIFVKLILFPLAHIGALNQQKMRFFQGEIESLQKKTKTKEEQARLIMEFYKKHGFNPFTGCLLTIVQIPILIALWQVFGKGIASPFSYLYSFIEFPNHIQTNFLGLLDLKQPSLVLGVLTGISQFFQGRLLQAHTSQFQKSKSAGQEFSRVLSIQTTYILPIFIVFISLQFPSAVSLYWITTNLFGIIHENWVKKKIIQKYGNKTSANPEHNPNNI